jgi:hypothetical protein
VSSAHALPQWPGSDALVGELRQVSYEFDGGKDFDSGIGVLAFESESDFLDCINGLTGQISSALSGSSKAGISQGELQTSIRGTRLRFMTFL